MSKLVDHTENTASESFLNVLIRANASQNEKYGVTQQDFRKLDPPLITDYGLIVIDWLRSEAPAINGYIYRLCSLVFSVQIGSDGTANPIKSSTYPRKNPRIMIFDGLNCFNVLYFRTLISDTAISNKIIMTKEADQLKLLVSISKCLSEQAALNCDLKLVVIYCDDTYIQDLMDLLVLHRLTFHVILVSYRIPSKYRKGYYKGGIQNVGFLKVEIVDKNIVASKCNSKSEKVYASVSRVLPKDN